MKGILVFGDSIVYGRGELPSKGWAGRLKESFEKKDYCNCFFNLGIPGDTSKGLLKRIKAETESRCKYIRPEDKHTIIIAVGINDSRLLGKREETSLKSFEKNVQEILRIASKHTKEVFVIGLTPVDEEITRNYEGTIFTNERINIYNNSLKKISRKNKLKFLDLFSIMSEEKYEKFLGDGIHPNKKGYNFIYKEISIFLKELKVI